MKAAELVLFEDSNTRVAGMCWTALWAALRVRNEGPMMKRAKPSLQAPYL